MRFATHSKHNRKVLPEANDNNSFLEKLDSKTVVDDESIEASIRKRLSKIESNLFDEYLSELFAHRQELT